jgi:hypothetical protein
MNISENEIEVLRELSKKYMQYASLPIQKEKMELWKALNRSEMQRPLVAINQLPWNELNIDGKLDCVIKDDFWRNIEQNLRRTIYQWENIPVDMVLDPFIVIPKVIHNSGYGISISEQTLKTDTSNSVVSHQYSNQIQTEEDIFEIKDMVITYDEEKTLLLYNQAKVIFEGIAPVVLGGGVSFHLGIWDHLSFFMGIENIYYDLADRPEFVHKVLDRITNATIAGIKQVNQLNISDNITNTCHCSHIYTDELLPDSGKCLDFTTKNGWSFSMAQLFTAASPQTTAEFEIPYINKLAENFGMMYYGCCERLDDRLDIVKKIVNLKKISCSPWSNKANFAENIGNKIIMSNKFNPSYLADSSFDENAIRNDLTETYQIAKDNNVNLEFILKDVSTVKYDPERLKRWAEIAMSIVEK